MDRNCKKLYYDSYILRVINLSQDVNRVIQGVIDKNYPHVYVTKKIEIQVQAR